MLNSLVHWAVTNRFVVILIAISLVLVGGYAFTHINVEAYPDPAPAIIEVIAQYPGASAEEVERQITIPLEVALSGMPGLNTNRSKSLFGLSHLRNQFDYGVSYQDARMEVLTRLSQVSLPNNVQPALSPTSPIGEIYRYTLSSPKDSAGKDIYRLSDLKTVQDWTLEREFRRVPGIADVVSFGGAIKRYEIHPDPNRLRRFGISLNQVETAIASSNMNAGGDFLNFPQSVQVVRGLGLLGQGIDPQTLALTASTPEEAARILREEERSKLHEIRHIALSSTNNVPVRISDIVEGGRNSEHQSPEIGVVAGNKTRFGKVSVSLPVSPPEDQSKSASQSTHQSEKGGNEHRDSWENRQDVVQGVVLLRKGEKSLPAIEAVEKKVDELNSGGKLLPGVKIEVFDDRRNLINRTTETVHENLLVGMVLVSIVLLLFLNHFQSAMIVAINIPLALLFAFTMLYFRGQSANLLSLGAVDFGIIVDSSVIMVECIFRKLSLSRSQDTSVENLIVAAAKEVQRPLFYSTLIMVCALLPLFLMAGPEGQIFGPMADAYAFALAGALILALTLSPTLCSLFLRNVKESKENFLVRGLQKFYLSQLDWALRYPKWIAGSFVLLFGATLWFSSFLGREFMPTLEEGNIYIRGTFPAAVSLDEVSRVSDRVRQEIEKFPEARAVLAQLGRPNDGTDPTGFYNAEFFVPLKLENDWPKVVTATGISRVWGTHRARTKEEIVEEMNDALNSNAIGVDWNFSQSIRDNVMETLSGVKGENSVKVFGPDLTKLESIANEVAEALRSVRGINSVGVFSIMGQTNLEFSIDREKCAKWNVNVSDIQDVLATAVGGKAFTQMVEGEKSFDVTLRWPSELRSDQDSILDLPIEVLNNRVATLTANNNGTISAAGSSSEMPSSSGNNNTDSKPDIPRRRLRDLVTPVNNLGRPDPKAPFTSSGASTIAREQGERFIAVKFGVRDRDLASAVADAQIAVKSLIPPNYRSEWSGEFQEMQAATERLMIAASLAMVLIIVLLYLALRSLLDVVVVLSNVAVICMGGIWALFLTGTNFNISAGVGFISILGVGMMNGLILVSGFNSRRSHGIPLVDAIKQGVGQRIRPLTMTVLTAILGMLPAALATKIGSQTQKPLAIVVVGGMAVTLLFLNLIPVLYSFYGARKPPDTAGMDH